MRIEQIDSKIERSFRDAVDRAAKARLEDMQQILELLDDVQLSSCIGLCVLVTGYNAIRVCGGDWPNETNLRKIASNVATTGELVKKTGLSVQEAYDFIARAALHFEPVEHVFPNSVKSVTLPFIVTAHFLGGYCPPDPMSLSLW